VDDENFMKRLQKKSTVSGKGNMIVEGRKGGLITRGENWTISVFRHVYKTWGGGGGGKGGMGSNLFY